MANPHPTPRLNRPNKATKISREIIGNLSAEMYPEILKILKTLSDKDPELFLRVWLKLIEFTTPKPQTMAVDLGSSERNLSLELRLRQLSGLEK